MNLENEKTKSAYDFWKNMFPESLHKLDTDRFDNLVLVLLENDDYITEAEIEQTLGNNVEEWVVDSYSTRFHTLSDMYKLMTNNGYIKQ